MPFLDAIFGSEQETSSRFEREPWGPTEDPLERLAKLLGRAGRQPLEFFPDQTYAPQTEAERQAIESLQANAGLYGQGVLPAWQGMLTAADVANNPYVTGMAEAIESRVNRNLSENILPQIGVGQVGQGGFGTSGDVAAGIAARGTSDVLAEQLAGLYGGAYGQGLGAQTAALGMTPGILGGEAAMLGQAGMLERGEEQRAIDEAMARFQFEQMEPYQRAQLGFGVLGPMAGLGGEGTSIGTTTSTPSLFEGIGGLVGAGAGLLGGFGGGFGGGVNPYGAVPGIGFSAPFGGYGSNPLYAMGSFANPTTFTRFGM